MRRKTRAVAGNLAALKASSRTAWTAPSWSRAGRDAETRRPAVGAAGRSRPPTAWCSAALPEIDESLVTGETARRTNRGGAAIHAGSVNFSAPLTMRVNRGPAAVT